MPDFFSSEFTNDGRNRQHHCADCGSFISDNPKEINYPNSAVVIDRPNHSIASEPVTRRFVREARERGISNISNSGVESLATQAHLPYIPICNECAMDCDVCSRTHFPDNLIPYHGDHSGEQLGHACPECAIDMPECQDCRNPIQTRRLEPVIANSGRTINVCRNCCVNNYSFCDNCQNRVSDGMWATGYGMCRNCYNENRIQYEDNDESKFEDDRIKNYGYKPTPVFHGEGRHYGVELETVLSNGKLKDAVSDTLSLINGDNSKQFVYLKHDSSIQDWAKDEDMDGAFEIVTHPATITEQKAKWDKFFDNKPDGLISDPEDAPCCGLHIHIEKQFLSPLAIAKISHFIHSPLNKFLIKAIARRESPRYAALKPEKKISDLQGDRYEAVNFQNSKTLELRLFAGTMDKEKFFQALEFTDALTNFAAFGNSSIKEIPMSEGFTKYVAENRTSYPNLHKLMAKVVPSFPVVKGGINPKRFARLQIHAPSRKEVPFRIGIVYGMREKDMSEGARSSMIFY